MVTAATGTVLIGIGAFWLSFMALADLAARSGIAAGQAWIWPLLVDGLIVVSTIAVVALDGRSGAWYPWALLICGALVSVAANALHAIVAAETSVPSVLAATVAAVPPLVLLASTHLTVVLTRSTSTPSSTTGKSPELPAVTESEPESAIGPEQDPAPEPESEVVLGRRERAVRLREAGWSNKAIADELGVHASTVGRWFTPPVEEPETTTEMETT
ncbi:excisionase [Gordonia phthalatica]|uniref:Excisionase n=1 Tax=Gordonia phthalatica TaxID=1136941 RepID=A0A0N9N7W2_9ACTN|nr:excisionase [Gordonia phthalatica]